MIIKYNNYEIIKKNFITLEGVLSIFTAQIKKSCYDYFKFFIIRI
jgi:hypothetical protein